MRLTATPADIAASQPAIVVGRRVGRAGIPSTVSPFDAANTMWRPHTFHVTTTLHSLPLTRKSAAVSGWWWLVPTRKSTLSSTRDRLECLQRRCCCTLSLSPSLDAYCPLPPPPPTTASSYTAQPSQPWPQTRGPLRLGAKSPSPRMSSTRTKLTSTASSASYAVCRLSSPLPRYVCCS